MFYSPLCSLSLSLHRAPPSSFVQRTRIKIWIYDNAETTIEGRIMGFDEYMNLVLDDAEEIDLPSKGRKAVGRILLKGDTIALMQAAAVAAEE
jgi:small nuclear ribonucleoprotein E